jgi:hypothetical protein
LSDISKSAVRYRRVLLGFLALSQIAPCIGAQTATSVTVEWQKVIGTSKTELTLQVVVNPELRRGAKLSLRAFSAVRQLGADYVRYVPWLPYPRLGVAELKAPQGDKTYWDFSLIDPMVDDFMKATEGHSVVFNFSTIPAWMFKTEKLVTYPDDPNQVFWTYTQGRELRDSSMKEAAGYYARLLAWYTEGGFRDENGIWHESGHHYKIAYWEVLNEIDLEHNWSPQEYTRFYDAVTTSMHKVDPQLKFMALALANPGMHPEMFEYFLNPANHQKNVSMDFVTYHFYAQPTAAQQLDQWQYTFFDQADGFLNTVRYVEALRKLYSPNIRTDLNELGSILPGDVQEIEQPGFRASPEPKRYWNLAGAVYGYLFLNAAKLGIDVVGESQLVGFHTQFPSVTMVNHDSGDSNARYWTLYLLRQNFHPGDTLLETTSSSRDIAAQAFLSSGKRKILFINKRDRGVEVSLPEETKNALIQYISPSTADTPPASSQVSAGKLVLEPFEIAVITIH